MLPACQGNRTLTLATWFRTPVTALVHSSQGRLQFAVIAGLCFYCWQWRSSPYRPPLCVSPLGLRWPSPNPSQKLASYGHPPMLWAITSGCWAWISQAGLPSSSYWASRWPLEPWAVFSFPLVKGWTLLPWYPFPVEIFVPGRSYPTPFCPCVFLIAPLQLPWLSIRQGWADATVYPSQPRPPLSSNYLSLYMPGVLSVSLHDFS